MLFTDPSEYKITIKNSKIFYKNLAGDVLFISKIFESEFFYDYNKLENNFIKSLTINNYIKLLEKEKYEMCDEDTNVLDIIKNYKDFITF